MHGRPSARPRAVVHKLPIDTSRERAVESTQTVTPAGDHYRGAVTVAAAPMARGVARHGTVGPGGPRTAALEVGPAARIKVVRRPAGSGGGHHRLARAPSW